MPDDARAAAQRIMDSRPRSIIDGKQFAADIMLVTRYVLADHNDLARLLGEVERLKAALEAFCWQTETMEREWEDGSIRSDHMAFLLNCLIDSAKKGRAALAAAPAGAGEAVSDG